MIGHIYTYMKIKCVREIYIYVLYTHINSYMRERKPAPSFGTAPQSIFIYSAYQISNVGTGTLEIIA